MLKSMNSNMTNSMNNKKMTLQGVHSLSHFFTKVWVLLSIFALSLSLQAQAQYINYHLQKKALVIKTSQGDIRISPLTTQSVEVLYQAEQKQLPSFALANAIHHTHFKVADNAESLTFSSQKLAVVFNKKQQTISYFNTSTPQKPPQLLTRDLGFFHDESHGKSHDESHDNIAFRFQLTADEKLMGGGERVLGMNRRGHKMPLYNKAHYGYTTSSNQMYFGLPAVMSTKKYLVLFDNSAKGEMDLGATHKNEMTFSAVAGRSAYILVSGHSYPELINHYVQVTGKQPLPPRWALGNYASRFGYRSEQEVRDTVNQFIKEDFPLDALVLDLYWFGKDIKGHMGNLSWDKDTFPQPKKMISDLKDLGVNTIMITEPFVLSQSKKWSEAVQAQALATTKTLSTVATTATSSAATEKVANEPTVKRFDFYFGNTGLIDIFNHKGQNWFKKTYQMLSEQGVNGWWGDLGEPEVHPSDTLHAFDDGTVVNADAIHNVYGHQWAKMVFNHQLTLQPNKRPFIMMRSGFAGSQRYGMIPWTGDVSRSWAGLQPQVELSLQMSLLGMAYTHSDLGGFAGGETFDKEMYIRWLQYGVFQPVYRPHAQDNIAPEPIFHDKQTKDILREFIKLRYQLLPYNYTLAYQNSTTGMPLMRPLFFEDESDLSLIDDANSYLWGDAFLVTPITKPSSTKDGVSTVSVNLPKGVWLPFFTFDNTQKTSYQGGQKVNISAPLTSLPVLVRAGAFIPMIAPIQSTKNYNSKALTLHYYHDDSVTSAQGEMYEDDGTTYRAIDKGIYELLNFNAQLKHETKQKRKHKTLVISLSREHEYKQAPATRNITLVIHHMIEQPKRITINGKNVSNNSHWNKNKNTITLTFEWQHQPVNIEVSD